MAAKMINCLQIKLMETNAAWYHFYVKSEKVNLKETKGRVFTRASWMGKWGNVGQRVHTSSDKMRKFWAGNAQHGEYS